MSRLKSALARLEARRSRPDDPYAGCNCHWITSEREAAARPPGPLTSEEIDRLDRFAKKLKAMASRAEPAAPEARRADAAARLAAARADLAKWNRPEAELERCATCPEIEDGRRMARIRLRIAEHEARAVGCLDRDESTETIVTTDTAPAPESNDSPRAAGC